MCVRVCISMCVCVCSAMYETSELLVRAGRKPCSLALPLVFSGLGECALFRGYIARIAYRVWNSVRARVYILVDGLIRRRAPSASHAMRLSARALVQVLVGCVV